VHPATPYLPIGIAFVRQDWGVAEALICRRCNRPVIIAADRYDTFEQMHYVCFHYEFEHDPFDPDEECSAGGCPAAAIHPRPDRRPPAST
jgi:hypothetical protein